MVRCSVKGCKSDRGTKTPGLSFYSFPEPDNLRLNWILAAGRTDWTPKPSSKICKKKLLIKKKKVTLLFPNAVPILEKTACIPSYSSFSLNEDTIMETENHILNIPAKTPEYTPRTLQKKWKSSKIQSSERLKKLRALREKSRRLTKKIAKLENVIAELKTKSLISEEDGDLLESVNSTNKEFLKK